MRLEKMMKTHSQIFEPNRWRHSIIGRRTFASYKVPPQVIDDCIVKDGQRRNVTFKTQKGEQFTLDASITSGCEISLPKKYQNIVRGNDYVEISIIDEILVGSTNNIHDLSDCFKRSERLVLL